MIHKKKIITAFVVFIASLGLCLLIIQNNKHVQNKVKDTIVSTLNNMGNLSLSVSDCSLNLFTQTVTLHNGHIKPSQYTDTSWGFKKAYASINLFHLLRHGIAELTISLHDTFGTTSINKSGSCDLIQHLNDVMSMPTSDYVAIRSLSVVNNSLIVQNPVATAHVLTKGTFTITQLNKSEKQTRWNGSLYSENSKLIINGREFIARCTGSALFNQIDNNTAHIVSSFTFEHKTDKETQRYTCSTHFDSDQKHITLSSQLDNHHLQAIIDHQTAINVRGDINLAPFINLYQLCIGTKAPVSINQGGYAHIDATVIPGTLPSITGSLTCNNLSLNGTAISAIDLENITTTNHFIECAYTSTIANKKIGGLLAFNTHSGKGAVTVANLTPITLISSDTSFYNGWHLQEKSLSAKMHFDTTMRASGSFNLTCTRNPSETTTHHSGTFSLHKQLFELVGSTNKDTYEIVGSLEPTPHFSKIICTAQDDSHPLIDLQTSHDDPLTLRGPVRYNLIQSFFSHSVQHSLLGKNNAIMLELNQQNPQLLQGSIKSSGNNFCIPAINNLVKNFSTHFTYIPQQQELILADTHVIFSKGSVRCPSLHYKAGTGPHKAFIHAPIEINNVLINWKKDFYSFICGNIIVDKKPEGITHIDGDIMLKRSLLRGDIFAAAADSSTHYSLLDRSGSWGKLPVEFSISLNNEKPIHIKTSMFEADADMDLQIAYEYSPTNINSPKITGSIDLEKGHFNFLENKLFIEYGKIQFLTSYPEDAIIDIIAKNKINKYFITLQANGTLKKNNLVLESTPELSEEQIISLLLTGSENATLQSDLAIMLMQNLNTYLASTIKKPSKATSFVKHLAKPFKYIQISPILNDHESHPGLKGVLSVPITNQLRAQVQKNINTLSADEFDFEAFGFNVEYFISDDINLKVVRDQHGEIGSELEVKFKF